VFKVEQRTPKCFKLKVFEAKVNFELCGLPRPRVASPLSVSHAPGISLSWIEHQQQSDGTGFIVIPCHPSPRLSSSVQLAAALPVSWRRKKQGEALF
jgi:hypothetical protein